MTCGPWPAKDQSIPYIEQKEKTMNRWLLKGILVVAALLLALSDMAIADDRHGCQSGYLTWRLRLL